MKIEKIWLLMLSVVIIGLVSGPVSHAKTMKKISRTCSSGFKVTLELSGDELAVYRPLAARFEITDARGNPVSGALLFCSLYMSKFSTGSNHPTLKPTETAGVYEGVMLFSQSGDWRAALRFNLPGGVHEDLIFEINGVVAAN